MLKYLIFLVSSTSVFWVVFFFPSIQLKHSDLKKKKKIVFLFAARANCVVVGKSVKCVWLYELVLYKNEYQYALSLVAQMVASP